MGPLRSSSMPLFVSGCHRRMCRVLPHPSITLCSLVGLPLPSGPADSIYYLWPQSTMTPCTSRLTQTESRRFNGRLWRMSLKQVHLFDVRKEGSINLLVLVLTSRRSRLTPRTLLTHVLRPHPSPNFKKKKKVKTSSSSSHAAIKMLPEAVMSLCISLLPCTLLVLMCMEQLESCCQFSANALLH